MQHHRITILFSSGVSRIVISNIKLQVAAETGRVEEISAEGGYAVIWSDSISGTRTRGREDIPAIAVQDGMGIGSFWALLETADYV